MTRRRSRFVPEVVQSSSMDCGPAALKSFVEGHGISVSYGRLREACQTDVDGTSIETLEELGTTLGVPLEQVLLPKDLVLLEEAEALPCIAVMRLPNGNTHFAVVWSVRAGVVQAMDPATGRHFTTKQRLLHDLYEHSMSVSEEDWKGWATSEEGLSLTRRRFEALRVSEDVSESMIGRALEDETAAGLAALDAALRTGRSLVDAGACRKGPEAASLVAMLLDDPTTIPSSYWSARLENDGTVAIRGAVLLRPVRGVPGGEGNEAPGPAPELSRTLEAARSEAPARPLRELWLELGRDGWLTPAALTAAFAGTACALTIEALLFRSLLELVPLLGLSEYRAGLLVALAGFMTVALVIDLAAVTGELRLGRRVETRLRVAFQEKIPRLGDRYFRSRLISDMAERNHSLHLLRTAPRLAGEALRVGFELVLTTAAIVWLQPSTAPLALLVLGFAIAVPLVGQPLLQERDLRVRSHVGGLSRFYLDALIGLVPLRVHGAQHALRSEHEGLLSEWARSRLGLQRAAVGVEAIQFTLGYGLVVVLLLAYLGRGGEPAAVLLLAYWGLNLPVLGLHLVRIAWRYPEQKNTMLRIGEPMRAPEDRPSAPVATESATPADAPASDGGASIEMERVTVRASGHVLLNDVNLRVRPGEHLAIVGPSGSGKTSLLGLLLGWHAADAGRVTVDGTELSGIALDALRKKTAWIDPAVRLWNRSLIDNLRYGNRGGELEPSSLSDAIQTAELRGVLEALPEGHQTRLGEAGGLVSGGEGQRVRLARGLLRPGVTLALLDEPFRGLDREHRTKLLVRAREHFRGRTLLCVTHDLSETQGFDRVCVMDRGRIVESGSPQELAARERSRYRDLLEAESALESSWNDPAWRRWEIRAGAIHEPEKRS